MADLGLILHTNFTTTVKTTTIRRHLVLDPAILLDTFVVESGHFLRRPGDFYYTILVVFFVYLVFLGKINVRRSRNVYNFKIDFIGFFRKSC